MPEPVRPDPLTVAEIRPRHLSAQDPIAIVVGSLLALAGALRIAERVGLTADELAMAVGALGTIAAVVRSWLERRQASAVSASASQREQRSHVAGLVRPQPKLRRRIGGKDEGGEVEELPEDERDTPVEAPERVPRRG